MLKHLFHISLRNFKSKLGLNFVNLLGLSTGLTAFAIIFYFYGYQNSFDKFHQDADQIHRVILDKRINNNQVYLGSGVYPALANAIKESTPEIEEVALSMYSTEIRIGELLKFENTQGELLRDNIPVLVTEASFLNVFDIELLSGDFNRLDEPFTGFISEKLSNQIFGHIDVVGKSWVDDEGQAYQILGVFKKWEGNTHIKFDLIKSYESIGARFGVDIHRTSWNWNPSSLFVKVKTGIELKLLEEKLTDLIKTQKPYPNDVEIEERLLLQNIKDAKLNSDFEANSFLAKSSNRVNGLLIIGILILIISIVNFVNFNFSIAALNAREFGIQKCLGADLTYFLKRQVVEIFILGSVAYLFSVSFWQSFKPFIDSKFEINPSYQPSLQFYLYLLVALLVGLTLSFVLPFGIIKKSQIINSKGNNTFGGVPKIRKGLMVFQWCISLTLVSFVFIINDQLEHLSSIDRNVKTDQILVFKGPRNFDYDRFSANPNLIKERLYEISGVNEVATSYAIPGDTPYAYEIRSIDQPASANVFIPEHQVDENYLNAYQHRLIAGRSFNSLLPADSAAAILNVSAVKALFGAIDLEEAIGKKITSPENEFIRQIIGVIEDYYHESPGIAHFPMSLVYDPESRGFYSVSYSNVDYQRLNSEIEEIFSEVFPGNIYHSFELQDHYNAYSKSENQLSSLLASFSIVAIILSLVGVVGLTILDLNKHIKEISIRKVLGANHFHLLYETSKGTLLRYLLALVVMLPIGYFLAQNWLDTYANHVEISLVHLAPAGLLLTILFMALWFTAMRKLNQNPVENLKEE